MHCSTCQLRIRGMKGNLIWKSVTKRAEGGAMSLWVFVFLIFCLFFFYYFILCGSSPGALLILAALLFSSTSANKRLALTEEEIVTLLNLVDQQVLSLFKTLSHSLPFLFCSYHPDFQISLRDAEDQILKQHVVEKILLKRKKDSPQKKDLPREKDFSEEKDSTEEKSLIPKFKFERKTIPFSRTLRLRRKMSSPDG